MISELDSSFKSFTGISSESNIQPSGKMDLLRSSLEGGRRGRRRRGGGLSFPSSLSRILRTGGFH